MRSVVLRSRPGRPWWQLTTRPSTAAVLGLVSLAAAAVQVALLSSPPAWYQFAVAGFWTVVGVAFLASAVGTRVRSRREAAARARRPVVAAEPFVPVPVVPARRRAEPARSTAGAAPTASAGDGADAGPAREADSGAPTADLTDAVPTTVHPVVTAVVPAPVAGTGSGLALAARLAAPSPAGGGAGGPEAVADPDEPTTRLPRESGRPTSPGARNRHAVRAVLSAEFAARALEEESERMAAGRSPLRDGRVRPAEATPASVPRPRETPDEAATSHTRTPDEAPTSHTRTSRPRPAHTPTPSTGATPARTSHRRPRKRRGDEAPAPDPRGDAVPEPRQAPERTGRRSGSLRPATPEPAAPTPGTPAQTPVPTPATPARAADPRATGTRGASAPPTPPSLPAAPRPRTPPARPASALTFGSPQAAEPTRSSVGRSTRVPADAGRHARVEESDRDAHHGPRSARHAAARGRR